MSLYAYRGRNAQGQTVRGQLEAGDTGAIADQLFRIGITPVEIVRAAQDTGTGALTFLRRTRDKVSRDELIMFSRQMYTLSKAGVPILRALAGLQESATSAAFARVIEDMRVSLDSGRELSAAMRRHTQVFNEFYISMVRIGEMTGELEYIFLRLFEHLDFENEMRGRVKAALRYPMFVVIAMAVAMVLANLFIIPTFAKMYEGLGAELPVLTRVLIGFSNFTVNYWWLVVLGLVGIYFALKSWVATTEGRYSWDRFKLRLPVAGKIVTQATLARFARSLGLSLKSGVPIVQALTTIAEVVDNAFMAERILKMRDGVESGESVLRTAVDAGVFSPVVLQMIAIGDETGAIDDLMLEIAGMYEREVEYDVKGLSAQIEPILIVFLAGFVLILALGILTPMWGMHKAVLGK